MKGINAEIDMQNQNLSQTSKHSDIAEVMETESRFDTLNDDEINEIASESNAKNTQPNKMGS